MEKNCERCFNKKAIFNCPSCDKCHNLCQSCDNFIHSLNNTKFHKRQYIYSHNKDNFDYYNDYNYSKSYYNSKNSQENNSNSFYNFQSYYNSDNINNKDNEYELSSIKNQIKNAQKNISEQLNKILLNIDNCNKNLNYDGRLKEIENNYKEKISLLISEKNKEIKRLELEMNKANSVNQKLIKEITEKNKDNNSKIIDLTNIVNHLTDELNKKEEEIIKIKNNEKRNEFEKNNGIEYEKGRISKEYEKKINNILNISEHNQQKLKSVIKEKEMIIQNLINCNKDKTDEFNTFINKINDGNLELKNITEKSIGLAKYNLLNRINN
jgi:hypothetical protein